MTVSLRTVVIGGLVSAVAVLAGGCAGSVTRADGTAVPVRSPEFEAYVERVFRQQNRLATELAFAIEAAASDADRRRLAAAEQQLLEACAELNALAAARRDGRLPGAMTRLRMVRTTPDCERAVQRAETALTAT